MAKKKISTKKSSARKKPRITRARVTKPTTKKVSAKRVGFRGQVLLSVHDFKFAPTDVAGVHEIWFPKSPTDVAKAVAGARGRKTLVRSGTQVATQDVEDAGGGIVINLKELSRSRVTKNVVTAQAAVTTDQLAQELAAHDLALPLDDGPRSMASNILDDPTSYLTRSLGALSDHIVELRAVLPGGKPVVITPTKRASAVAQSRSRRAVITEAKLRPVSSEGLWMYRVTVPYPGLDELLALATGLFEEIEIPEKADLVLRALNARHQAPLISVSVLGSVPGDEAPLTSEVNRVLTRVFEGADVGELSERRAGSAVLTALAEYGQAAADDATIDSTRLHEVVPAGSDRHAFLVRFTRSVHDGIAFGAAGEGKLDQEVRLDVRLQARRDGGLEVLGYAYTPSRQIPSGLNAASVGRRAPATAAMAAAETAVAGPIPSFRGPTFGAKDADYRERAKQYATSSYPAAQMSPFLIAYPQDVDDVRAAILFASTHGKRVVARSGGHSYSGLSSGGQNTIVLSMDAFASLTIDGDVATVGPSVRLTDLAGQFKKRGITMPHGECPFVAIGGHAQTGGYGHLIRSFGLAMDHVQSFEIVLADGTSRSVTRPASGSSKDNDDLFWAVLGGNAGSFGIVTQYTFKCVRDSAHPKSFLYSRLQLYKKELFLRLMHEIQTWTAGVEADTLPAGRDLCITVESGSLLPKPVMLIEPVYANLDGATDPVDGEAVFASVIDAVDNAQTFWDRLLRPDRGIRPLSYISDSFVRRFPATTWDGREFRYPYKKRVNCTAKKLTDAFVARFVDLLDDVVTNRPDVKLVFQMFIGGGAYRAQGALKQTSIPHRDITFGFVFDLFYLDGGQATAIALQNEMQVLIDQTFSNGRERRLFWGSFDVTDITNTQIRDMYYDITADYARLQSIKQQVDAGNVFSTSLTVKP